MSTPPDSAGGDGDSPDASSAPVRARATASPSSAPCAFFARGRCVAGDACAYSHIIEPRPGRSRATHASNCGCTTCVPRAKTARGGDDDDDATVEDVCGHSSESEEGAVPRDVAAREALDRDRARDAILADAHTITQPSRVMFWRTFLSAIGNGRGNKLAPYWLANGTKRRRVDDPARHEGVGALVTALAAQKRENVDDVASEKRSGGGGGGDGDE